MNVLHGTCVTIGSVAVLFRGKSGSGKSDLALRLLWRNDLDSMLVADDQVILTRRKESLWARAPKSISGLLEVRGIGLVEVSSVSEVRLSVVIDLLNPGKEALIPRMPGKLSCTIEGISLPKYQMCAFEVSAPDKVAILVRNLGGRVLVNRRV